MPVTKLKKKKSLQTKKPAKKPAKKKVLKTLKKKSTRY